MGELMSLKCTNGTIKLYDDKVVIERKGFFAWISQGLVGNRIYYYKDLKTVEYKKPGMINGYMKFIVAGTNDVNARVNLLSTTKEMAQDPNTVILRAFNPKMPSESEKIYNTIIKKIEDLKELNTLNENINDNFSENYLNTKLEDELTIKKNIELGYEKDKKIKDIPNNNELNTLNENINNIKNLPKQNQGLTAVQSSKKININNLNIPHEVLKLLWIGDGKLKNYYIPMEFHNYKDIDINFIKTIEPSCIFTELPIEECEDDLSKIDNLDYYPNYFSLQPNQKFCYLKWLEDVMQPIPIGYVFIFYYGLERHLIEGDFESAFQMILKLKDRFNNTSFQAYSTDALLIAIVLKNKTEYFNKVVNYINNPKLLCIIKTFINEPLTAKNLIDIRKYVGFNNNYYIQKGYDLFEKTLEKILIDKYKIPVFPTNHKIIENATSYLTLAIANFSLDKRTAKIPNIFSNKTFSEDIKNILLETHTTIKDSKK